MSLRILFHLNTLERGGVERVVTNLANQFSVLDFDVFVATQWYGEVEFTLNPKVRRLHVGLTDSDENKSRLRKAMLRVKYLRDLIKAEKPDVVLAFDQNANYRAVVAATGLFTPVIISIRNFPQTQFNTLLKKLLASVLYKRAAGCVFQTKAQYDFFSKAIQKKSRIILNPLNHKYLGIMPPPERNKEIVHSSRLEERKNQAGIIRAIINIHRDYPDYILKIYGGDTGDGTKEKLEKIITEQNAGDYIKLMGSSDFLEKELSTAALYIFNSHWEGLPNALMEAMALGLPVISTDCQGGGAAAIITDGVNGLLIPLQDDVALEHAIRRLLAEPEYAENLGMEARNICEKCNIENIAKEWLDYIKEVINE